VPRRLVDGDLGGEPHGVSTATWVAFTTATTTTPGASPSSRTASDVINTNETILPYLWFTCQLLAGSDALVAASRATLG
jgi:hypothetical protein